MVDQRLLERIAFLDRHEDRRARVDPIQITASIVRHLQRILNTKQGGAQIAEDYGLPDFTALVTSFSSEAVRDLEKSIKDLIRKYEPRLTTVKVTSESRGDEAFSLYFKIEASITTGKGEIPVVLQTVMSSEGKMNVSG